jgi:quinoprotein glucose dehydrogenase
VKLIPRDQFGAENKKQQDNRIYGEFGEEKGAPYGLYRTFLLSPNKVPCNPPPWGTTEAVDLFTGKQVWDVPLGTLVERKETGTINLGGPIVTAGGLVFTAAAWICTCTLSTLKPARNSGSIRFRPVVKLRR